MVRVENGPLVSMIGIVESQRGGNVTVVMADKRVTLRWDQIEAAW
jgi:hypothetical protein